MLCFRIRTDICGEYRVREKILTRKKKKPCRCDRQSLSRCLLLQMTSQWRTVRHSVRAPRMASCSATCLTSLASCLYRLVFHVLFALFRSFELLLFLLRCRVRDRLCCGSREPGLATVCQIWFAILAQYPTDPSHPTMGSDKSQKKDSQKNRTCPPSKEE